MDYPYCERGDPHCRDMSCGCGAKREQERHERRIMLMRMAGDTNRMEFRSHVLMALAVFLGVVAFILMGVS